MVFAVSKKKYVIAAWLLVSLVSSYTVMAAQSPAALASLHMAWSTDVDGRKPADRLSFSAPVVTGQGNQARIVIAGSDARIHIYDMAGKEVFRLPIEQNS
ncbi:MAG: hypothetical protein Q9M10_04720, partial [Mariprofundaceae bacterium]|nr:hypothetical protein [Mariprofundaceae bacterium]